MILVAASSAHILRKDGKWLGDPQDLPITFLAGACIRDSQSSWLHGSFAAYGHESVTVEYRVGAAGNWYARIRIASNRIAQHSQAHGLSHP